MTYSLKTWSLASVWLPKHSKVVAVHSPSSYLRACKYASACGMPPDDLVLDALESSHVDDGLRLQAVQTDAPTESFEAQRACSLA
jgi:hypothetical protein